MKCPIHSYKLIEVLPSVERLGCLLLKICSESGSGLV
jgi:hypothetical protein